ncbi:Peptidoglycan/LPS O-acetylase OafA/YrhL, contains acyltransferase and SGNH-hydrolase domains [Rosenbergiella nectarea]|uniref:Peptidoglycan/LPS O-acetylase OafA/YrhL, contains acyltransferase and SGNH-hydrolase domains n=1 Tax=Rosenbergiella nectarea TaxID=988801 RepID=A0A1H9HRF0_9GAMM|nr:acyltransferase [Rosenbergiella nectarea]SEQ64883.1 Peptidoglycan/LPS O-acetylase OafA/YrhL, contains acyltransferase and SGNH-hydrolase domains [Rosenbergiella nectarea]
MSNARFNSLDGMRGLMAVAVLYSHLIGTYYGWLPDRPLVGAGFCVMYFFMLSGFVLSASHKEDEGIKYFFVRFSRLFPLHFITTISMLIIYTFNKKNGLYYSSDDVFNINVIIKNILFMHGITPNNFILLNEPSWSISLEFWCSLLVPFILMKLGLKEKLISLPIIMFLTFNFFPENLPPNFLMASICMLIGNVAYTIKSKKSVIKIAESKCFELLSVISIAICILAIYYGSSGFESYICLMAFSPLLLIDLTRINFILKRILCCRFILFLGFISFPLYLFHESIIVSGIIPRNLNFYIYSTLILLTTIIISYLYNRYIGSPLYKNCKKIISKIS